MKSLRSSLTKLMRETADKIDAGTCELSETEAMDIMRILSHQVMSKEDACIYLNIKGDKFNSLVREGKLPRGRKRRGFKELVYYKDELDDCLMNN